MNTYEILVPMGCSVLNCNNTIEIRNRLMFDFYPELPLAVDKKKEIYNLHIVATDSSS